MNKDKEQEYLDIAAPLLDGRYYRLRQELGEPQTEEETELLSMVYESETQVIESQFAFLEQ